MVVLARRNASAPVTANAPPVTAQPNATTIRNISSIATAASNLDTAHIAAPKTIKTIGGGILCSSQDMG
jgi:hypothetical protein